MSAIVHQSGKKRNNPKEKEKKEKNFVFFVVTY